MERLMSDLLATARGEQSKHQHFYNNHHLHVSHFIADELRRETVSVPSDDIHTPTKYLSDSDYPESINSSSASPGYIPSYSPAGYSSTPTYIRGDFYDISPPSAKSKQDIHTSSASSLSFSIDTILGSASDKQHVLNAPDEPAVITSSLPTLDQYDWTFVRCTRTSDTTSLPVVHWCHACNNYCSSLHAANDHNTKHSLNRDPSSLRRCFARKYGYVTTHIQTNYLNRIQCGLCDRIVSKYFFNKHVRCHESLICRVCGLECATQTRLDDHLNTHTGNQPHICNTCGAKFSDRRKQLNHSRQHKASLVSCKYCDKTFKTRYTCDVHERIHTGYRPYSCTVPGCMKAFPQKVQLRLHMRLHVL